MLIRMRRTGNGSPDGRFVKLYLEGEVYDVPEVLHKAFVDDLGWAEPFSPSQEALPVVETKMLGAAPENKMVSMKRQRGRPRSVTQR